MNLQRKYQLNLLKIVSILSIPFIVILFILINYFIQYEVRELLKFQTAKITKVLEMGSDIKSIPPTIVIEKSKIKTISTDFNKVPFYDIFSNETEKYFEMTSIAKVNNEYYKIIVRSTAVQRMDILLSIFFSTLILIGGLSGFFYIFSNRLFGRLLQPFHYLLAKISDFSLSNDSGIDYVFSDIYEFDQLSKATSTLSKKVTIDYQNLKQFTENASHEIQTPLAIIRNKVENIVNQENLSIEMSREIQGIDSAVNKLNAINKGLILLAKIGNNQFSEIEKVDIGELIGVELLAPEELYFAGKNTIKIENEQSFIHNIDPILAEIMTSNLIKNMITHSAQSSNKKILIKKNRIIFSNTGDTPILNREALFTRFYKESLNGNSLGLGLAIVKAICDQYNLMIFYTFKDKEHLFVINKMQM